MENYKQCRKCVMDNIDEDLFLNDDGECERCVTFKNSILPTWNYGEGHEQELADILAKIKKKGRNKKYDCILGLSGGLDSSYMLHLAVKEWGLRPFVFHIDTGWNLPVAEDNIRKICSKLGVDLHVEKMDWNEMREMQLAWFRTGLSSLDDPQDHAFIAVIDKYALKLGVKYILNGYNIATEIIADPESWAADKGPTGDGKYMKDVCKRFCSIKIKKYTFTNGFRHKFYIPYILGVKTIKPLNLVPITKQKMIDTLTNEYGFIYYGQKHFEDLLTKFLEAWWLPSKFGYDVRKSQLSSLILTGQITRDDALKILKDNPISNEEAKKMFSEVAKRLEISEQELYNFYNLPKCGIKFKSNAKLYNFGIKLYEKLGLEKRIRK